jgi:methionine-rich copper-binding protein CopC
VHTRRTRRSRWARLGAAGVGTVATLAAIVATPGLALAHARLASALPAPGSTVHGALGHVSLGFDESVTLVPRSVSVTTDLGVPVALDAPVLRGGRTVTANLQDQLAAGRYVLAWRIRSDDGHLESGSYFFSIVLASGSAPVDRSVPRAGAVPRPASPTEPVWPVLVAAGLAVAAGLGAAIVVRRGLRAVTGAPAGDGAGPPPGRSSPSSRRDRVSRH